MANGKAVRKAAKEATEKCAKLTRSVRFLSTGKSVFSGQIDHDMLAIDTRAAIAAIERLQDQLIIDATA